MVVVAEEVVSSLTDVVTVSEVVISEDSGNEELLSMDMGQAAQYFGIDVPIKQRDRKGTPKPRQQLVAQSALLDALN